LEDNNPLEALTEAWAEPPIQDAEIIDPTVREPEPEPDEKGLYPNQKAAIKATNECFNRLHSMGLHEYWLERILIPHYEREIAEALYLYRQSKGM